MMFYVFNQQTEVLSLYTTSVHDSGRLRVCVRLMKGFPDEDDEYLALDRTCLLGTSAVMFYVGEADPDHGEVTKYSNFKRTPFTISSDLYNTHFPDTPLQGKKRN